MRKQIHFVFHFSLPNGKLNDKLFANDFQSGQRDLFAMQDLKCEGFHFAVVRLVVQHEGRLVLEDFMNDQRRLARFLSGVAVGGEAENEISGDLHFSKGLLHLHVLKTA